LKEEDVVNPKIEATEFGSITIAGQRWDHDVLIRLDGSVEKRKKKLSKEVFGTSHRISEAEIQHVFEEGAQVLVIGAGQFGLVCLDDQAQRFLKDRCCEVLLLPTPEAVEAWNSAEGKAIGLFHVTC
jgi:hypothetical protein